MSELLVGCFTQDDGANGVVRFAVDDDGLQRGASVTLTSPAWLVRHDADVLAVQHLAESAVTVLTGTELAVGATEPTHGVDACHAALNPSATVLAVAHYSSGSVAFVPVDGSQLGASSLLKFDGHSGVDPKRQDAPHAHQCVWVDEYHVLVCDLGADQIRIVRYYQGEASQIGEIATTPGFGPRHLVTRTGPEGDLQLAVCGELTGEVASHTHYGDDWELGWSKIDQVAGSFIGGSAPSALRQLDDHRLVLANRFIDTLAVLEWAPEGTLTLLEEFDCGGNHPRDLVVRDGQIWVANMNSGDVCHFDSDQQLVSRTAVERPAALLFD